MVYVSFIWCEKAMLIILLIDIRKPLCPYNIFGFYMQNTKFKMLFSKI